ncbi:hypothetical protein KDL67_01405 [bacterium]|nr:hypothetical protein [bacterium]
MRGRLGNPGAFGGKCRSERRWPALVLLALVTVPAAVGACRPQSTSPTPPGGDPAFVLDPVQFESEVRPVLVAQGCNNAQCHGGGPRGSFALSPPDAPDATYDFDQASLQVWGWDRLNSPLLRKPLSQDAGGVDHAGAIGGAGFDSTDDPGYVAFRDWILAGEYR